MATRNTYLELGIDTSELDRARKLLSGIPWGAEKATYRALNKAARRANTRTVQSICKSYNIRPGAVRAKLTLSLATRYKFNAQLGLRGSPLELMKFAVTPKKPPSQKGKRPEARTQTVAGVKFGTRHVLPHAFVARMKNGHVGIYSRRQERRAIRQRYTTSVPQMMASITVMPEIMEEAQRVMAAEFDRQIELLLSQRR